VRLPTNQTDDCFAVFGKLMDDSGSATAIARTLTARLGPQRAILSVVLACALLTYGGVSLFVVAFVVVPVADALFRRADLPHRLIPAAVALGAFTFTMTALPGTPSIPNAIPMPYFGTTTFAAPGLGLIGAAIMLGFGAVILALPAFARVTEAFLAVDGPLVSLAFATNVISGITGSASGGLMITMQALGGTFGQLAAQAGIAPELMHRVATIAAGGLSSLPHNGAVVTLLAVSGATHRGSYRDGAIVMLIGSLLALLAVIGLGLAFGSF